jgi:hypothetical protein
LEKHVELDLFERSVVRQTLRQREEGAKFSDEWWAGDPTDAMLGLDLQCPNVLLFSERVSRGKARFQNVMFTGTTLAEVG